MGLSNFLSPSEKTGENFIVGLRRKNEVLFFCVNIERGAATLRRMRA